MTWRDKLEIGLKEDAPFRRDNLPQQQVRGPEVSNGPGRSPEIPLARGDHAASRDGAAPTPDRRSLVARHDLDTGCRRRHTDLDV
jgi:hypothetical protein